MKRIVVIDDERSILDVVEIALEDEGVQIDTSQSGTYLQQLEYPLPDLIILDLHLQGEDGRLLCQKLKSNASTRHIPVILFSAATPTYEDFEISGADDFLSKPFHIKDLLDTVHKYLQYAEVALI